MTQVLGAPGTILHADFNGVELEFNRERFTLGTDGRRYWADVVDLDEPPESRTAARFPMELVTGSHHMQVFWLPAGAGNAQIGFPFTWLVEDARWVPRESAFVRDPHAPTPLETWNMTCIRCHVTAGQPRPRKDEGIFDTRLADFGISCEACHGPGEEHARLWRLAQGNGGRDAGDDHAGTPDPRAADPIVHPRRLDHVRSSHVCAQCHSIKWFEDDREGWSENGFRYRPGDDLEVTTPVVRPSRREEQPWLDGVLSRAPNLLNDFFWSDGMIRVAGREFNGLLESACFQRGELSCLSCHSMHEYASPNDQLRAGMDSNRACVQCHDADRYGSGHTRHAPDSPGSVCYNCHMPHTSYALLKGIRQHQIDSPSVSVTLATGRPNACNLCHVDRSLEWTARHLAENHGQPAVEVPPDLRHVSAVVRDLLAGDAGQRVLAAWHLGWKPARAVAGEDWQAPLLARLLNDPYAAVRYVAARSLRSLPGHEGWRFDHVAPAADRSRAIEEVLARAPGATAPRTPDERSALLLRSDGTPDAESISAWLSRRDDRPVRLRE